MRIPRAPASRAASAASARPLKVQNPRPPSRRAWWRPLDADPAFSPVARAWSAAATAPPADAATDPKISGDHPRPLEHASSSGSPVRTASTYARSWTRASCSTVSGSGATISAIPATARATSAAFASVSKSVPGGT